MKVAEMPNGHTAVHALPVPRALRAQYPLSPVGEATVHTARAAIRRILAGDDPRLLVVVGPCSIHDAAAALDYAHWLQDQQARHADRLLLVMRAYVEKARTRFGWKGLLHDPRLDGSGRIDEGVGVARRLLIDIAALGVPVATEFVDPIAPAYLDDVVAWAAIGARTVTSPVHRALASALPCPVGFKNTTDGNVAVAIDAVAAARRPQHLAALDDDGRAAMVASAGNADGHLVLRGGLEPNHDAASVAGAARALAVEGLPARLVVDCSHGNARGERGQVAAATGVAAQLAGGSAAVAGVMIESCLVEGRQPLAPDHDLRYGQSVTDACLGLTATADVLASLAAAATSS